ncbi:hypothetical protein [Fervidobacterium islandicum]|uniref:Uncharacterized protein n=1 Tax=Fervidobacterium islandicum TaxID=2423 RepID=A0AAI8CL64_FERIS|nr:hypothetical protein [Fervidobacterium islandicum]AMW32636.1 hypothetical protein NA23_04630 [Fervidobacterium islandicum]
MIKTFLNIIFGSLISTLIGSFFAVFISFSIISRRATFRYQPLYFFNDIMTLGVLALLWYYVDDLIVAFSLFSALATVFLIYKLLVGVYSIDRRFRLLILSLGVSHNEYSLFILERNLGKLFANLLKFYVLCLIGFLVSLTNYASDIGFFSLIVGLVLTLFQAD